MAHSSRLVQEEILNWAYAQPEEEINDAIQTLGLNQSDLYAVNMMTMVKWLMGDYSAANFVPEPELSEQQAYAKREQHRRAFIDSVLINKSRSTILDPNVDLDHPHPFTTLRDDLIVVQKLSESRRRNMPPQAHNAVVKPAGEADGEESPGTEQSSSAAPTGVSLTGAGDQIQQQYQQQMDLQWRQQQHQQQMEQQQQEQQRRQQEQQRQQQQRQQALLEEQGRQRQHRRNEEVESLPNLRVATSGRANNGRTSGW